MPNVLRILMHLRINNMATLNEMMTKRSPESRALM